MAVVAVFSAFTIYLQYCYTRERVTEELLKQQKILIWKKRGYL